MVFSTPFAARWLNPGAPLPYTLLGFGSCEITVGNQSLFIIFFTVGGSSEIGWMDVVASRTVNTQLPSIDR